MIFMAKGTYRLGRTKKNSKGKTVLITPAQFTVDPDGGSVAVGMLDDDTGEQIGQAEVFGDFDPAGYLAYALQLLAPRRAGNLPDFESIVKQMYEDRGNENCPLEYYCERGRCEDCIVHRWMEEVDEEE